MADTTRIPFVDTHVHHWDLGHPWYPAIQEGDEATSAGLHDTSGLRHNYLPSDYQADSSGYDVRKIVHVSATTAPKRFLDEARWLDQLRVGSGWPAALIGTVEPDDDVADIAADIETQAGSAAFRGIRVLFGLDPTSTKTEQIFGLLSGTKWLFELTAKPSEVGAYLPRLERASDITFVLEHAGWPEADDADHFAFWRRNLIALERLGNVHCKISGLPMALGTVKVDELRPWVETCLEVFGLDRCFFGSNFPVDALFATYDEVLGAYVHITDGLAAPDRHNVFVGNAERLYAI
jgi:L-fuconolactonase